VALTSSEVVPHSAVATLDCGNSVGSRPLGLTRNRVLSSHRREDTSTPKYSPRRARLQGFLYTCRNVARRASAPRGRMSQASPLGSPSFSPQSPSIGLPPSFLPSNLPHDPISQVTSSLWPFAAGQPCQFCGLRVRDGPSASQDGRGSTVPSVLSRRLERKRQNDRLRNPCCQHVKTVSLVRTHKIAHHQTL
jgi:hypothetical protein